MSQPFDLDAAVANVTPEPLEFTWAGEKYEMPAMLAMPVEKQLAIVGAAEDLNPQSPVSVLSLMTLVVGDDLLGRLQAAKALSAVGMMRLLEAWLDKQGLGKSVASSPSSASTEQP